MDETKEFGTLEEGKPVILEQKERTRRFGLECVGPSPSADGILFKAGHWEPGGEYVLKLIVRNVSTSVKKFKYKLPSTRYFSLAYPEVIILSPGMFKELDVIFRPVEYNPYDDTLYIQLVEGVGSGGFHVPVRATIDKLIVTTPFGLDLGYCPTHQTTSVVFQLTNAGEVDAPFRWQPPHPFVIEPSEGIIPVGQSWNIKVSIFPTDASVFVSMATCVVGEGVHAIIPEPVISTRISAIGKYTYIVLSEPLINFGEVLSGTPPDSHLAKKEVILRNQSEVPAEFELIRQESDTDEVFDIQPRSGVLPPQSEVPVVVRYHALASGCFSLERYSYRTPGGAVTELTCTATSTPSVITAFKDTQGRGDPLNMPSGAPKDAVNFRDLEVGRTETRILFLRNDSKKDCLFNIQCGGEGIFKVSPRQGVIPAQFPAFPIKLTFTPPRPINYYRRIFILIGDNLPLFFDVMGTGFIRAKGEIKEQRPAPLRFAHVQAYRNRAVRGLGGLSPPELDDLYAAAERDGDGDTASFFAQVGTTGTRAMAVTSIQNPLTRTGEATRTAVAVAHELFIDDTDSQSREVIVNKTALDFGYTPFNSSSDSQTLLLTNNTNGKISVVWELPPDSASSDQPGNALECAFSVDPPLLEINAGQSAKCRVTFRPRQSNRNFLAELEAFAYFKNQRTFRLVNDSTLTPPWCLTVKAQGHTFSSGQLLATVKLTGSNVRGGKLVFPTCFEGENEYQTFTLRNTSNLPSTFRFELGFNSNDTIGRPEGSSSDIFSVAPSVGEVDAESFVLVTVRFRPTASRKYTQLLRVLVNGDAGGRLVLEGNASVPFITFPQVQVGAQTDSVIPRGISAPGTQTVPRGFQGSFFLKPTHVGLSTSRQLTIRNSSRLPLRWVLRLPAEATGVVSVTPSKGLLRGNEAATVVVAFAPRAATRYSFKLRAKVYPVGGRAQRVIDARQPMGVSYPECLQSLSIFIVAPGEMGAVLFSPARVSIPVRLVNTQETRDIFLENVSDSDLRYEVHFKEEFVEDTGGLVTPPKQVSSLQLLSQGRSGKADGSSLFCDPPTGIISARSRLRLALTYNPIKAGLFELSLFCKLKAVDPSSGAELMLPNEETAILRGAPGQSMALLPLASVITSRAAFPRMVIEDVRVADDSLVADVEHLWRQFSLAPLNHDLAVPLTDHEVRLNDSVSTDLSAFKRYSLQFTPAVVGSPVQTVFFRLRNSGFLPVSFHLHLPNEKTMDLEQWCDEDEPSEELNKIISIIEELQSFTITPHSSTLGPGQSCDLVISYSHSSLKFGGVHRLPVHFKLDHGKQFLLELQGLTLPPPLLPPPTKGGVISNLSHKDATPPTDLLLTCCAGAGGVVPIRSVPIGLSPGECPRQLVSLFNVSGAMAAYEVDLSTIAALCDSNFGAPIVRVANPKGIVPARGRVQLEIYFYPLEAVQYDIPLVVKYQHAPSEPVGFDPYLFPYSPSNSQVASVSTAAKHGGGGMARKATAGQATAGAASRDHRAFVTHSLSITLRAFGYDPRLHAPPLDGTDKVGGAPGSEQLICLPKQLATLSCDRLDFDVVPQGCVAHRLLVLRSCTDGQEVDFALDDASSALVQEGLLTVTPASGRVAPGEQAVIEVRLGADCRPQLVEDCLRFSVREIVKPSARRRAPAASKAMSRAMSRKAQQGPEHESVVKRITASRAASLLAAPLADGRVASMPTTVDAQGRLVSAFRTDKQDHNGVGVNSHTGSFAGMGGGGISFDDPHTPSLSLSVAASTMAAMRRGPGLAEASESTAATGAGSSPERSVRTPESGGSRGSRRSRRGEEEAPPALKGLSTTLLVRVKAAVFPVETVAHLLGRGPLRGLLSTFAPQSEVSFIPALPLGYTTSYQEPEGFIPKTNVLHFSVSPERQGEVRAVTEEALFDIFRSLLSSATVQEYTREAVGLPAAAAAASTGGAAAAPSLSSTLGIYFGEVSASPRAKAALAGVLPIPPPPRSAPGVAAAATGPPTRLPEREATEATSLLLLPPQPLPSSALALPPAPASSSPSFSPSSSPSRLPATVRRLRDVQRVAREEKLDAAFRAAAAHADFVPLAADILRNTMLNLVQEAVFDEFSVFGEPLELLERR